MIKVLLGVVWLVTIIILLTGCSAFEQKISKHQNNMIKCYPEDAVGCIGWLGNKPIMIEEDL